MLLRLDSRQLRFSVLESWWFPQCICFKNKCQQEPCPIVFLGLSELIFFKDNFFVLMSEFLLVSRAFTENLTPGASISYLGFSCPWYDYSWQLFNMSKLSLHSSQHWHPGISTYFLFATPPRKHKYKTEHAHCCRVNCVAYSCWPQTLRNIKKERTVVHVQDCQDKYWRLRE